MNMPVELSTVRGFLLRLEVGRAGLVVARLIEESGASSDYRIEDLDADPERFNERLSKLAILRDAMDRAEPLEIEYLAGNKEGVRNIERVARISRDSLGTFGRLQAADGLVVDLQLLAENRAQAETERADRAEIGLFTTHFAVESLILDMQIPERQTSRAQFDWILAAHRNGEPIRLVFDAETRRIVVVGSARGGIGDSDGNDVQNIDGFVESLGVSAPGIKLASVALVRFTTAPAFSGTGNYVPLTAFGPLTLNLLVAKGSDAYRLFEAGLRDNLRMQVRALPLARNDKPVADESVASTPVKVKAGAKAKAAAVTSIKVESAMEVNLAHQGKVDLSDYFLASGPTLLAPLAAAARPVWIRIVRETLDHGPEGIGCTEGLPCNDLSPITLRDLKIPYPAQWTGWGCFNHGVYRFQFKLDTPFRVTVDGESLCLHAGADENTQFAHACLCGEHEVTVSVEGWTCDKAFIMDVYRLR
jgi:hypothetical protein